MTNGVERVMRVTIVSGLYPYPDDPSRGVFVHRQVRALREAGVEARVLCPVARHALPFRSREGFAEGMEGWTREELDGVPVLYVPYWHIPHAVSASLEAMMLKRSLQGPLESVFSEGPDLLHAYWLFPAGYVSTALAREIEVPSVVTALGSDVHRYPRENSGTRRLTIDTLVQADLSIAVSRYLETRMQSLGEACGRTTVVYNGVDSGVFHPPVDGSAVREQLGLPVEGMGVCFVGRFVEEKGVRELMDAFVRVANADPGVWLALVGDGPLGRAVRDWSESRGISDRVFLPGRVPHEEVAEWMRASDVLTLPSYAEGLPNVVMEAIACGLPVIATDVGGVSEIENDRRVLKLIPPRDTGSLYKALRSTLDAADDLQTAVNAASERVRTRFTWHAGAEKIRRLYGRLCSDEVGSRDFSRYTTAPE